MHICHYAPSPLSCTLCVRGLHPNLFSNPDRGRAFSFPSVYRDLPRMSPLVAKYSSMWDTFLVLDGSRRHVISKYCFHWCHLPPLYYGLDSLVVFLYYSIPTRSICSSEVSPNIPLIEYVIQSLQSKGSNIVQQHLIHWTTLKENFM